MKTYLAAAAALLTSTSLASAAGLDRTGQSIAVIFKDGNYAELSFGRVTPDVSGNDVAAFGGSASGNVAQNFTTFGTALKFDVTDQLSAAIIFEQPFGSDIAYPAGGSVALGGTTAIIDSSSVTAVMSYQLTPNFSAQAGLRYQMVDADITLAGLAYGGLNGYNAAFAEDSGTGYLVGVAYERPEIALRVALTYNSAIEHELMTTETVRGAPVLPGPTVTTIETPESWNLEVQSGVAQDTLVFGSIRYSKWSELVVSPTFFGGATGGASIADLEDGMAYTLGVGRRFNDQLSGRITIGYEPTGEDDLVSPLAPSNGLTSIALGVEYEVQDGVTIGAGARYTWLGDAMPETGTPDVARANFTDNHAVAIGGRIGFAF